MNTTETNKKLAEFLGWEDNKDGTFETAFYWEDINANMSWNVDRYDFKPENMLFNSDWSWLMLVVQAISNQTEYELVFGYGYSYWNNFGENPLGTEFGGYEEIANIYEACSMFVDWYNGAQKELK